MSLELQCNEGAFFANGPVRISRFPTTSDHSPKVPEGLPTSYEEDPTTSDCCRTASEPSQLVPDMHAASHAVVVTTWHHNSWNPNDAKFRPFIAHICPHSLLNSTDSPPPPQRCVVITFPLFINQKISPCDIFWF